MTRTTRFLAATIATLAATLAVGCSAGGGSDTPAEGETTTSIKVVYAAIAYEPLYLAEELGYFDEVGLDVEMTRGGVPQDNIAQAVGGSADIIVAAWDNITTSVSQGMPIRILGGNSFVSNDFDTSGIVVRADSRIESLADLKGKTLAFDSLGGGGSVEVFTVLADAGVSRDDVSLTAIPYAGQAAALEEGHVDAVFPSEPFYSQISQIEGNSVISNPVRETRAGMPITLWAATQQWLDANEDAADAFLEAMDKAIAYYEDPANLEQVKQIRAEVTQQDVSKVSDALPPMRTGIDAEVGQRAVDQLVRFDMIEAAFPVEDMLWSGAPRLESGK